MRRDDLEELHYITPISNVASILAHGILSHRRAAPLHPHSIAMAEIQDKRRLVRVPGGRPLHEYVNLYICARNPMMFKRRGEHGALCVLCVSTAVLDLPGVVIADQNASSKYVRFGPVPTALERIDKRLVFAENWTHPDDQIEEWRHKSIKCAEVLVPDRVDRVHVVGAYVSCPESQATLASLAPDLFGLVNAHLFFR